MKRLLVILLLCLPLAAQKNESSADKKPAISPETKQHLLASYRLALLRQNDVINIQTQLCEASQPCKDARAKLTAAITAFNDAVPTAAKQSGFPDGTYFEVNSDTEEVKAVVPEKKAEGKK